MRLLFSFILFVVSVCMLTSCGPTFYVVKRLPNGDVKAIKVSEKEYYEISKEEFEKSVNKKKD